MQKVIVVLSSLLAVVNASPFEVIERDPNPAPLVKRDTEIVYLANCKSVVSCCPPLATTYSSKILVSLKYNVQDRPSSSKTPPIVLCQKRRLSEQPGSQQRQLLHHHQQRLQDLGRTIGSLHLSNRRDIHRQHRCRCSEPSGL